MTETNTRRPRQAREYGMVVDVRLFVPVKRGDLKSTVRVSEAVDACQETGDIKGLFDIEGARVHSLLRPARFDSLKAGASAGEPAADEAQTDIDDAISEAPEFAQDEAQAEFEAQSETGSEEAAGSRRGRRAA